MTEAIQELVNQRRAAVRQYLGDGVYVCWDGDYIWLDTERADGVHSVGLDAHVLTALWGYVKGPLKAFIEHQQKLQEQHADYQEGKS